MIVPRLGRSSLGAVHEVGLACAVTGALLLVLLGGTLPDWAWIVVALPWIGAGLSVARVRAPRFSAGLLSAMGLAWGSSTLLQTGLDAVVLAFAQFVLGLIAARALVHSTRAHDSQLLGLSLVLVLAGSALNVRLSFAVGFLGFAVAAVWALATRQLLAAAEAAGAKAEDTWRRTDVVGGSFFLGTSLVAFSVLAFAGVLFVLFPRVGIGDIGAFIRNESRIPTSVGLSGSARRVGGNEVVARVAGISDKVWSRGLYLRAAVYDEVRLDGFSQSEIAPRSGLPRAMPDLASELELSRYTVTASPSAGARVLTLGGIDYVEMETGGKLNPLHRVNYRGVNARDEPVLDESPDAPLRYSITGSIADVAKRPDLGGAWRKDAYDPPELPGERYLALPPNFDVELQALARQVARNKKSAAEIATAIRGFLFDEYKYSLTPPDFDKDPVRVFLLDDKKGHCEFFAAAQTLLLRANGVHARVVGGFQGGGYADGMVVFQERHAHAWVEWFDPKLGWVLDDATPYADDAPQPLSRYEAMMESMRRLWDERVLDYALEDQKEMVSDAKRFRLKNMRQTLTTAGLLLVVGLLVFLWMRRRQAERRTATLADALLLVTETVTECASDPAATVREAVGHARRAVLAHAKHGGALHIDAAQIDGILSEALNLYEQSRFAVTPPDAFAVKASLKRVQATERELRRVLKAHKKQFTSRP